LTVGYSCQSEKSIAKYGGKAKNQGSMRILMISKACLVGTYQTKLEALARGADVELAVLVPPTWDDPAGQIVLERAHTEGYQLWVDPLRHNGRYHTYTFPTLRQRLQEFQPDILHIDEEPYNLATAHALWWGRRYGCKTLFFTWQNLYRNYPPPFRWLEKWVLDTADYGVMGNRAAVDVFRRKGFDGRYQVIPQFGVAAGLFAPPAEPRSADHLHIGFAGRFVSEKGVDLLLQAVACLPREQGWTLHLAGKGPEEAGLRQMTKSLQLEDRVIWHGSLPSGEMPRFLQMIDVLVLPSRTRPNWAEQFGRILVEAMACETVVVGSTCGEIPHVIGDAGLVFSEDDVTGLLHHLQTLLQDPDRRHVLGRKGGDRFLNRYTQQQIAEQTVEVYRELLADGHFTKT